VVVTVEEHSVVGGLGGAVAEWAVDRPRQGARLVRVGTADAFIHEAYEQGHARQHYGLTVESIVERTLRALAPGGPDGAVGSVHKAGARVGMTVG
jgi:transketolase